MAFLSEFGNWVFFVRGDFNQGADAYFVVNWFTNHLHVTLIQPCGNYALHSSFINLLCFRYISSVQLLFQDKKRTVHTSTELYIHQNYDGLNFKNDIALIKFPKLKRFKRNMQAICIPRAVNMTNIVKAGNNMIAVGWGTTRPLEPNEVSKESDLSNDLKKVKLPFKETKFCKDNVEKKKAGELKKNKAKWYFNSTTQFCAGDITGQSDTCDGDSGGPAMVTYLHPVSNTWRWFQVGIISWGNGCAIEGEAGYYTKVSAYIDWIDNIVNS